LRIQLRLGMNRILTKNNLSIVFALLMSLSAWSQNSRTYMNSSYEVTTSEVDASYYRTVDFLPGGGARVIVYYLQGKVKMEGSYFDNSLKTEHGKFLYFYRNGQSESEGEFNLGKKCGIWKRFNYDGSARADRVYPDASTFAQKGRIEKSAQYPGGYNKLLDFVSSNAIYPKEAVQQTIEGVVKISFKVDEGGLVRDVEVVESGQYFLDRAALECMWKMPLWQPAERSNQTIPSNFILPITFEFVNGEPKVRVGS